MIALEIVALYDDAWQHRHGDFSDVPLAGNFVSVGSVSAPQPAEKIWPVGRGRPSCRGPGSARSASAASRSSITGQLRVSFAVGLPTLGLVVGAVGRHLQAALTPSAPSVPYLPGSIGHARTVLPSEPFSKMTGVGSTLERSVGAAAVDFGESVGARRGLTLEPTVAGIAAASCLVASPLDLVLAASFAPIAPHRLKPLKHDLRRYPEWIAVQSR